MPDIREDDRKTLQPIELHKEPQDFGHSTAHSTVYYVSTASSRPASNRAEYDERFRRNTADGPVAAVRSTNSRLPVRVNWQLKAVLPVAFVMLNGLVLFLLATLSLRDPERHVVLTVAGGGAVTVCAVLIFVLAFLIQRPMIELQEKIAQVGDGDLNARVSFADRNDEVGDLGRNFNRMVEQLRHDREEIDSLHRTQMSRAEHLATLGELATGLAHEIRNPLAGISGVIEIIGRDLPPTSPARAVVKDVRQEIAQINRIVSDLLETARPRRPQTRLGDLNTTVEHAVMLARQQSISRPIVIDFKRDALLPEVEHDSDQIHQVLLNLLLNAIQAIDKNGYIEVGLEREQDEVGIYVKDNGRGIAPQNLANIFRPFFTTKGNGTGLGLSLARRIVEAHGGRIDVASSLDHGSKFVVTIPIRRAAANVVAKAVGE
jgi:signal transduction histidine kinase